ncbi:hypothetical protein Tco_0825566, partial [Tanacetum coccineum]
TLGAEVDEPMVDPVINEVTELIVEVEEQMVTLVIDIEGDLAMLFGDDDSSDDSLDDDEDDKEVWEVGGPSTAVAKGHSLTLPALGFPVPLSVSDAEVADGIAIGEIDPKVSAIEGQVQTLQADVQHRDVQIQQLQALVSEMSSHENTLMQCILRMDRCLAD